MIDVCVREIARVREREGLFVSGCACLCGHVWKVEVGTSMFSPITFPSCVLRPGFSLTLELTILVILVDHQIPETPTCLHLSVLGLHAYTPHTWLWCRCWGSKIRSWCSCCKHRIDPFPQPRYRGYGTTQVSEEGNRSRVRQGIRLFQCCYCGNLLDDLKCGECDSTTLSSCTTLNPSKHDQIHHFMWFK